MLAMSRAPKKETVKQPEVELIDYVLVRDPLEPEKVGIVKVRALVALDAGELVRDGDFLAYQRQRMQSLREKHLAAVEHARQEPLRWK